MTRHVDRRTFLRASGVAVALPWLESVRHRSHLADLIVARIEAHLNLMNIAEAGKLLLQVDDELRRDDRRFSVLRQRLDLARG